LSQFRRDPLSGGWVIIATERGKRPSDFGSVRNERRGGPCVFCEGYEYETPPEVLAVRAEGSEADGPGWQLRVVPNKYAALGHEGHLTLRQRGLFAEMSGLGTHDVVIETPKHNAHLCDLALDNVTSVVRAYRDRAKAMLSDGRIQYVQVFKNWGSVAGATQEHSHSQMIGLPVVPRFVMEQLHAAREHRDATGRCLLCDIVRHETDEQHRVVRVNDAFVTIAPYASRFPFELHIYPRRHRWDFIETTDEEVALLARMLKEVLFALRIALLDPPFNYLIHTRPRPLPAQGGGFPSLGDKFHWHLEIIPRLTHVAGFEWGTGFYINPTPPERAALFLRDVMLPTEMIEENEVVG
jgi:UDPglucose--hexose-1-phosphate uridylyltransferase